MQRPLCYAMSMCAFLSTHAFCAQPQPQNGPSYNPATLGDNFDKQRFVQENQAAAIGKNIQGPIGMIATENQDGTVTVTACNGLKSRTTLATTSDVPTPAFNAVVDAAWGLSGSFLGITFGLGGSSEKNVTGVPLMEASIQSTDFMDDLSQRLQQCHISSVSNAYIIASANLFLITSKTFLKGDLNGDLIYIKLAGNTYSETDTSTFYVVSVFALPIAVTSDRARVLTTLNEITAARKSVLGLPSDAAARRLSVNRNNVLGVSKLSRTGLTFSTDAVRSLQ